LLSLLGANPKEFAAKAQAKGLTPAQLKTSIQALWYSLDGAEAPQDIKLSLALADQQAAIKKQQADFEAYKAKQEQDFKNQQAEAQVSTARARYQAGIDAYLDTAFEGAPLVKAFASGDTPEESASARQAMVSQLFTLALAHAEANPDEPVPTPAELVRQLEVELDAQVAPLKKRGFLSYDPKATTPPVQEDKAPSALTNQRAATASKQRAAVLSKEERHAEAMKALEAAGRRGA
jgi:hypothetical protein